MKQVTLIISAAGLSSRMGDFKPLMKVDGVPNIIRELDTFFAMGIREAVVITGFRAEDIIAAVRKRYPEKGDHKVVFLNNPDYAITHMYDSLKIGLQYVKDEYTKAAGSGSAEGLPHEYGAVNGCADGLPHEDAVGNGRMDGMSYAEAAGSGSADGLPHVRAAGDGNAAGMSAECPLPGCDPEDISGVLTLPVDVPMAAPFTIKKILTTACSAKPDAIFPECCGEPGHPIFIHADALDRFLAFNGKGGLRGAYLSEAVHTVCIRTPDHGSIMDSDTPEAYARLLQEAGQRRCPDRVRCEEILRFFVKDKSLLAHSRAVAELAYEMAGKTGLDVELCYAGGMLHDVAKGLKNHAEAGADCLHDLGYERIASLARTHTELPAEYLETVNENLIVFLADKMVRGSERVTIDARFAPKREKFRNDPEAMKAFERRYALAKRCEEIYDQARKGTGSC